MLPLIIRPEQIGFIMGRYILDNVIIIWEGMEWARSSNHDTIFIKIDFKKAYDRIEQNFIIDILDALGFGPIF